MIKLIIFIKSKMQSLKVKLKTQLFTYADIYEKILNERIGILDGFEVIVLNKFFTLSSYNKDQIISFSINKLKLIIQRENEENYKYDDIYSSIQIEEKIKDLNNPYIKYQNQKINYKLNMNKIFFYIEDNSILIYEEEKKYKKFVQNPTILNDNYKIKDLSPNFYIYFQYNKKEDEKEIFNYIESNERDSLEKYFYQLIIDNSLHFFKFTGPSSIGKSTGLIKFSKNMFNCVYLNLKILKKLENEPVKLYNLIISECSNLSFNSDNNIKNEFINLLKECEGKKQWNIIKEIFNFYKKRDLNLLLIFDQFKSINVDIVLFEEIKKEIINTKIKIIICSSINNKDIQSEILKTIKKFRTNPEYNIETQDYFFYVNKLYQIEETNDNFYDIFKLFGFLPKYKYLIKENSKNKESLNKEIQKIIEQISKKIIEFYTNNYTESRIAGYLLYITSIVGQKIDFENPILEYIPLKYFVLNLSDEGIEIEYFFPSIQIIIKDLISKLISEDFFKKQNINQKNDDIFYSKIKWIYFEYCAKYAIENQILLLNRNCEEKLTLKNIVNMDKIIDNHLNNSILKIFNNEIKINIIKSNTSSQTIYSQENIYKNLFFKTIDDYRNEGDKDIIEFIPGYENSNIIINQDKKGKGDCIDQAALFFIENGKRIFLGFQMKCYSKNTYSESITKINKNNIKDNYYYKIPNHCKKLLGIHIDEWHYVLVIYYNKLDKIDGPFCNSLVNHCQKYGIDYIFFNPIEKKFYNKQEKLLIKYSINDYSNLDSNMNFMYPDIIIGEPMKNLKSKLFLQKKTIFNNDSNIKNEYIKIRKEFKKNIKIPFQRFIQNLETIIEVKNLIIITSYKYCDDEYLPFPAENYLFLFKQINSTDFILLVNKKDENYMYDMKTKTKISFSNGFSKINVKENFYVFKFDSVKKKKK